MIPLLIAQSGAIVAGLTAFLGWLFTRKRQDADTKAVEVKTELELNAGLWKQVGGLESRVEVLTREVEVLLRRDRIQRKLLQRHEAWDQHAVIAMRNAGIEVDDPPPLNVDDEPDPHGVRTRAEDTDRRRPTQ